MTDDEFRALLDRHGADLGAWPAGAAREARRLLARSTDAQAMLDEMVGIELALSAREPGPPADLAERIFEKAFGRPSADAGRPAGPPPAGPPPPRRN
ncbi:hypothetical protein [Azospirillum sp. ST 5-10]|uniref:hypothetical protein n=1 Tax=unclassified Azospirillum TaxID=2630922 RepID=UPI003F4A187A